MARQAVTVFYDVPDWAFHNVAASVARIGAADCAFHLLGRDDWFGRPAVARDAVFASDVAVFLWRFDLLAFLDTLDPASWGRLLSPGRPAFATVVYDHLYQSADELAALGDPFALSDAVAACSPRLRDVHAAAPHLPDIAHVVPDGVDLARFRAGPGRRAGQPLRIGWVGNSEWGETVGRDLKGRHGVFEPALARLTASGRRFERRVADRAERPVPRAGMPGFYHDLDVLVCTSAIEGTPNPVLEAVAAGVAVVSTDVGVVRDVLGPAQAHFILPERSPDALARALAELIDRPETVDALREENLARRDSLAWETRWPLWRAMLDEARAAAAAPGAEAGLRRFRARQRRGLALLRRAVAGNRAAYRAYEALRGRFPGAIRHTKALLAKRAAR
jgi:glycosyltransferase involved in cell wall biosynthesis